jgi:radical SAM superfamily enzyme YgiQ (UPF0313 family)
VRNILLVNPSNRNDPLENVRTLALPPLSLALLAGCTPPRYEVRIVDEAFEDIDFDQTVDLVAVTCMTPLAPRAYAVAQEFRRRGIPVVLGGIHASMLPQEAIRFADSVVTGEAEATWATVLEDAEQGRLRRSYQSDLPSLERLPQPRRDLLPRGYFVQTVQTSRGCPFDCRFCSVTRFNGGRYRLRPLAEVIDEIEHLSDDRFFFIDDNIVGSGPRCAQRAAQLFERLQGLGKSWGSQTCINIADNQDLLSQAAASGAKVLFIGFESIDESALVGMNKRINLPAARGGYRDAIRRIRDCGIAVVGGFIFGCDHDTPSVFERTVDFIADHGLDGAQFTIQTPLPGTRLYQELAEQGRLLYRDYPADWRRYNVFEVVFRPQQMSQEELKHGQLQAYQAAASLPSSLLRAAATLWTTRSLLGTAVAFSWTRGCYAALARAQRAPATGAGAATGEPCGPTGTG